MKKLIFIYLFTCFINIDLYTQPLGELNDFVNGSFIYINTIRTRSNDSLYCIKWNTNHGLMDSDLYILTKMDIHTKINKNRQGNKIFPIYIYRSEMNNNSKNYYYVYDEKIMILQVKKNRQHLNIKIKKIVFQEGIFEIDLNNIYEEYKENDIVIDEFPLEKDRSTDPYCSIVTAYLKREE